MIRSIHLAIICHLYQRRFLIDSSAIECRFNTDDCSRVLSPSFLYYRLIEFFQMKDAGNSSFVCPNDRQLQLRAK
jgi:hypothetical protein